MRRRFLTLVCRLVLAAGVTLLPAVAAAPALAAAPARQAGPPLAHAVLVLTVPSAAAELDTAPDQVAVQFSDPVLDLGAQLKVGVGDDVLVDGPARVQGATISLPLGGDLPAGRYQVLWRATSIDGHVVSGGYAFTVARPVSRPAAGSGGATTVPPDQVPASGAGGSGGTVGRGIAAGGKAQWMLAALAAAGAGVAVISSRRRVARQRTDQW